MLYIHVLELINLAIKHGLLKEEDGKVYVYRKGENIEGWYLEEKDTVAKELMHDKEAIDIFFEAFEKKGVKVLLTDYSWLTN